MAGKRPSVVDLRTLVPLDKATVLDVKRTGRALLLHEDTLTGGFGGRLAALISRGRPSTTWTPPVIVRVASWDTGAPTAVPLEQVSCPRGG